MVTLNRILYGGTLLLLSSCTSPKQQVFQAETAIQAVNPFIGTDAHGHTYPGATYPFGAVQLSPDTRTMGWDASSGYHYSDSTLLGFSHTHLSGTGCSDLADILFKPFSGANSGSPLPFSHKDEKASPGYYSVFLQKENILTELTATLHCGVHRYTYRPGATQKLLIDLEHSLDKEIIQRGFLKQTGDNEISGMRCSDGWIKGQNIYFVARFSKNIAHRDTLTGNDLQVVLSFGNQESDKLECYVGISAVSCEKARENLLAECSNHSFDALCQTTQDVWKKKLSCIEIYDSNQDNIRKFYTALYHTLIVPNQISDVNEEKTYSTLSLWDTFRTWNPLMALIDTTLVNNMIQSMLRTYDKTGELPVWPLWDGETYCMIGYHSVSVIADAYSKGIRGFDTEKALQAMKASAEKERKGSTLFNTLGYIPADESNESVSCQLEYCYDSWCIAQFARATGHMDDYRTYLQRSQNYKHIFNKETRFFMPKLRNGQWAPLPNLYTTNAAYTEATPWQYRFFVPHDPDGLIRLFGGPSSLTAALDNLFAAPPTIDPEIPDISGYIGQYVHGNEPSHGIAYLYDYAGQPWKTQQWTRRILNEMYGTAPDGICGNEDCGQMSAWFIMTALGFYPACPGNNEYVLTAPLFEKAVMHLANGNLLTITANASPQNCYIRGVSFNGTPLKGTRITYNLIKQGGTLQFELSNQPSHSSNQNQKQ